MFEVLALVASLSAAPAAAITAADRALLAETDPFARAPASSRSRMEVSGAGGRRMAIEVWRSGADALTRFLDPKERGKYLLRLAAGTYFISPGARQPIRLPPSHRLAGAVALDELLGVPLETSHDVTTVKRSAPTGGIVEFELVARSPAATYPRLRWVVSERDRLPLRADFLLADGRVARVLEWKAWRDRAALSPKTMVLKDTLRGGSPATVEIVEFEARAVPAGLFSLTDPAARRQLEPPAAR